MKLHFLLCFFRVCFILVRKIIPRPSHVRPSVVLPSADIGYVVWDTVDARKNPAASIHVKVGGSICKFKCARLSFNAILWACATLECTYIF